MHVACIVLCMHVCVFVRGGELTGTTDPDDMTLNAFRQGNQLIIKEAS